MPQLIADNGQTVTLLTDDGRQVEVAKPFAEPFLPPAAELPGPGPEGPPLGADQGLGPLAPPPAPPQPPEAVAPLADTASAVQPQIPPQEAQAGPPPAVPVPPVAEQPVPGSPEPAPQPATPAPRTAMEAAQAGIQGIEQQQAAAGQAAQAESAGQAEVARVYDVAQREIAEQQAARDKFLAERQAREQQLMAEKQGAIDKWSNYKVDRSRRWNNMSNGDKAWSIVGVVLSALGNALTEKQESSNAGLDALMANIEADVAEQMAERDRLGQQVGLKQGEIADFRSVSQSRAGEFATRMAAKTEWLSREVAKIGAKTQSVAVKANAEALVGQLQAQKAQLLQGAVTADRSAEDARKARGLQAAAQAEQRRQFDARLAFDREELGVRQEAAQAKAAAEGPQAGKVTGNEVYGVTLRTQDPKTGQETVLDHATVENKESSKLLNETIAAAQKKLDSLADIKSIGAGRNLVRDEDKATIQAAMAGIRIATQSLIKGIPSDKDQAIIDKAQGMSDPAAFWDVLDADERKRVLGYVEDVTTRETNRTVQQYLGPGASFSHKGQSVTEPSVPTEPDKPAEIRARMAQSSGGPVTETPITNKRSSYSTPFIEDARAAIKADKDPMSLQQTKALLVQEILKLEFVPSKENVEAANELRRMAKEIDSKVADLVSKEEALQRNEPAAERRRLEEAAAEERRFQQGNRAMGI